MAEILGSEDFEISPLEPSRTMNIYDALDAFEARLYELAGKIGKMKMGVVDAISYSAKSVSLAKKMIDEADGRNRFTFGRVCAVEVDVAKLKDENKKLARKIEVLEADTSERKKRKELADKVEELEKQLDQKVKDAKIASEMFNLCFAKSDI